MNFQSVDCDKRISFLKFDVHSYQQKLEAVTIKTIKSNKA